MKWKKVIKCYSLEESSKDIGGCGKLSACSTLECIASDGKKYKIKFYNLEKVRDNVCG